MDEYINIGRWFSVLHRRSQIFVVEACEKLHLTYSEYVMLLRIYDHEGARQDELATMLYRYARSKGCDCSTLAQLDSFSDAASVADYALESMQWSVANGIVSGDGGRLLPNGKATRAQCAKMVAVFYDTFVVTE